MHGEKLLTPPEEFFLNELFSDKKDAPTLKRQVDDLIERNRIANPPSEGLLSILIRDYLPNQLTSEQLSVIRDIIRKSYPTPQVAGYLMNVDMMRKTVNGYLEKPGAPYQWWLPNPTQFPFTNRMIDLASRMFVLEKRDELRTEKNNGLLIDSFEHQPSKTWGIWMSRERIRYNPGFLGLR